AAASGPTPGARMELLSHQSAAATGRVPVARRPLTASPVEPGTPESVLEAQKHRLSVQSVAAPNRAPAGPASQSFSTQAPESLGATSGTRGDHSSARAEAESGLAPASFALRSAFPRAHSVPA